MAEAKIAITNCSKCQRSFAESAPSVYDEDAPRDAPPMCVSCSMSPDDSKHDARYAMVSVEERASRITKFVNKTGEEYAGAMAELWDIGDVLEEEEYRIRLRRRRYDTKQINRPFAEYVHRNTKAPVSEVAAGRVALLDAPRFDEADLLAAATGVTTAEEVPSDQPLVIIVD